MGPGWGQGGPPTGELREIFSSNPKVLWQAQGTGTDCAAGSAAHTVGGERATWTPRATPCRLDELLGGGLREGTLLEVAGETSSGKTQLALAVAALGAARGEALVWVDTTGSFAPQRLVAMAGLGGPGPAQQVGLRGC